VRKNQRGFTLIEIVVVVFIVGILSSIAVVNYNKVQDKAEAARIATQLHYLEDAVIEAVISGATYVDFRSSIRSGGVGSSVLSDYVTEANMADVPAGMELSIASSLEGDGHFSVWITLESEASHAGILNELEAMFPRSLGRSGDNEWVRVDSKTLALVEVTPTP